MGLQLNVSLSKGVQEGAKVHWFQRLALDWACEKPDEGFKSYDLLFALDLRAVEKGMSVMDAIHDQLLPSLSSSIEANAKSTAIFLDGFDEGANVLQHPEWQDLFKNKWLQESLVIVTTRPHKIADFNKFGVYPLVSIEGFSSAHAKKYVDRFFKSTADHVDEPERKAESLVKRIRESSLFTALSHIPIMLTMICLLWTAKEEMPETTTSLYQEALLFLATHKEAKYNDDTIDDDVLEKRANELILKVGDVALNGIFEDRLIFKATEFKSDLDELCHLGIISKEKARSRLRPVQHVSFLHKTFQEMCAGMYWASLADDYPGRFQDFLNKIHASNYRDMEVMLRFACARSTTAAEFIIQRVSALSHTWMADCFKQQHLDKYIARQSFTTSCNIGSSYSDPWYLPLILLHESQVGDLCHSLVQLFKIETIHIAVPEKHDELLISLNFFLASYLEMSATNIDGNQTKNVNMRLLSCPSLCLQMLSSVLQFMHNIESVSIHTISDLSWDTVKSFAIHRCILKGIGRLHALENVDFASATRTGKISGIIELFCRCEQITKQIKRLKLSLRKECIQYICNLLQQSISVRSIDFELFDETLKNRDLSQVFGAVSCGKLTSISLRSTRNLKPLHISLLQPFILNMQTIHLDRCLNSSNFQEMCLQIKEHICNMKSEGEGNCCLPYQELTLKNIPITQDAAETFAGILTFMKDLRLLKLHNVIDPADVKTIAKSLHRLTNLQSLDLSHTKICDATVDLCNSLKSLSNLGELLLSDASLEEPHSSLIGKTLQYLPALRALDLSDNKIGPAMRNICEGLRHCRIKNLMLEATYIDDEGLGQLPFRELNHLETLHICTNISTDKPVLYGPEGIENLFQNLHFMPSLKYIEISYHDAWHDVSLFLKECYNACSFEMGDWPDHNAKLTPHSIQHINEFVETHKHLQNKRVRYSTQVSHE